MRRYWLLAGGLVALLATAYLAAEALDVALLTEPDERVESGGAGAALLALGLLMVDAVAPVASSVVMISLGAVYGAATGIALAWLGRLAMALVGFAIGRRGGPIVERVVGERERARADALLEHRGALAIVLSRPVPLLAEAVTILAGASRMPWRRAVVASAVGSLPEAAVYGAAGGASAGFEEGAVVWAVVLAVAGALWLVERRQGQGQVARGTSRA